MFSKHWFQCGLAVGASLLAVGAVAASAGNHYVTVGSDTVGVEEIVPVDDDFYVTTRGVGAPDFIADISVSPNFSWRLVYPSSGKLELGIGASDLYEVEDSTGSEDSAGGRIEVLKLDIAPSETNICWKSSGVTLSLTPDSALGGGTATWSSEPTGISGSGTSIAVNPGSLAPGEYVVTAASTIVPSYADTCVVRIIKVDVTQAETYVCWKSSAATLNLTADSYLGDGTAEWTSVPTGISGSGTSITFNPSGLTPTGYVVTARSSVLTNCTDTCTVNVVKVELDNTSEEEFFRSTSDVMHFTVTPPSFAGALNVSLTGFDSEHWNATYDGSGKKIDLVNLIETSEPMAWLDNQLLSVSATITGVAGQWNWTKKLDLKKRLDGIRDDIMDGLSQTLAEQFATAPGAYAANVASGQMKQQAAMDSNGIERKFSDIRIGEVADVVKEKINGAWSDFTGTTLPGNIYSQNLHDQVTDESWKWKWNTKLTITAEGGSISVDQGGHPHLNPGDWIKAVNNNGWTSKLFDPQKLSISSTLTGDGHVGHALFKAKLFGEVWCSFEGYKDPETQDWTNGGHFGGMTVGLLLECWF